MTRHSNKWPSGYLPDENIYQLVQNTLREIPGYESTQDGSGQSVQRHQEQLPAQALQQQCHDARNGPRINTKPPGLEQQSFVGSHQPQFISPYMENGYAPPPWGVHMQPSEPAPLPSVQYQKPQPQPQLQPLQQQYQKQARIPQFDGPQSLQTTGWPKHASNVAPRPQKRKVTDDAEYTGRGPSNIDSLKRAPSYFPRPEMATERHPQPYPMSDPVKPAVPNLLDTRPDASRPCSEDKQLTLEAPPSKAIVPSTRDLSAFSYKPQNPTGENFLRDHGGLVQPLNDEDAAMKSSYDPKTIARDILIASGRHPSEPCLNHHLMGLRDIFAAVGTGSDLDTFRWDIVDVPDMQFQQTRPLKNHVSPNRDPDSHRPQPSQPKSVQQPPQANQNSSVVESRDTQPQNTPPSIPGSVRVSQPTAIPPKPMVSVQLPPTPNSSRLQQFSERNSPALQRQPRQSQVKPAGGPRKEQSGDMVGTKTAPRVEVAIPSSPVPYPVYACEWANCPAELHNVELLKKHVLKCHVPYSLTCGWRGCTCSDMMTAAQLLEHVKTNHIGPLAWKLGDGPSMHRSGEET